MGRVSSTWGWTGGDRPGGVSIEPAMIGDHPKKKSYWSPSNTVCQTLSALSFILTTSLLGYFYSYFTDEEIKAQRDKMACHVSSGGSRIQIWSLFQARGRLGASPVLDMPDRICGCWWPTIIPGRVGSSVEMSVAVDYKTRSSVSGTGWVTGFLCKVRKGWLW